MSGLDGKGLATQERRALARLMFEAGDTIKLIAAHFGVSYERAQEVVSDGDFDTTRSLAGKGLSTEQRRTIAKVMFLGGESVETIARHFGVGGSRAYEVVVHHPSWKSDSWENLLAV